MPRIALANFSGVKIDRVASPEAGLDEPHLDEMFKLATALDSSTCRHPNLLPSL